MAKRTVEIQASKVQDADDCLAAAEQLVTEREGLEDWQVSARWTDEDRESITVTVTE